MIVVHVEWHRDWKSVGFICLSNLTQEIKPEWVKPWFTLTLIKFFSETDHCLAPHGDIVYTTRNKYSSY